MPLDTPPIERSELAARLARADARIKRAAIEMAVVLMIGLTVGFGLAYLAQPPRAPYWVTWALMIAMTPMVIAIAAWFDYRRSEVFRSEGACCSHCNAMLRGFTAQLALTTGRCGKCGSLLVSDGA